MSVQKGLEWGQRDSCPLKRLALFLVLLRN